MLKNGLILLTMMKMMRPLPIGMNKKVIRKFKDEPGEKVITELITLRAKVYANLKEDGSEHKRAKGTKKCIIKREIMFENYRESLKIKSYQNRNKDLEVIIIMRIQKKLIK